MRRMIALAGIAVVAVIPTACADGLGSATTAGPMDTAAVVPVRAATPPPPDAAVTRQVCAVAERTASRGLRVFTHHMAALETAAARNDQTAMVAAATAITTEFAAMAATLGSLSKRSVSAPVRVALVDASASIRQMGSIEYVGTPADQHEELREVADAFAEACH